MQNPMTLLRFPLLLAVLSSCSFGLQVKWFRFDKQFIAARYPEDSAFGSLTASNWARSAVHPVSCSGKDGEVHIGVFDPAIQLKTDEKPISSPAEGEAPGWGVVAELPNVRLGSGDEELDKLKGETVAFHGYYRVWNEGHHAEKMPPPSNPNHVFEVHPAWGFTSGASKFEEKSLVAAIPEYNGYGASKFKAIFEAIKEEEWLRAYQDDNFLFVELGETPNFFQLPVRIRGVKTINGGHELRVDVFSDKNHTKRVFRNLRCITVSGSPIDGTLAVGKSAFLLGFFSVNLKKAMKASASARSEEDSIRVVNALEFFVFGRALKNAVSSSDCAPEPDGP